MIEREYIKEGNFVYQEREDTYHVIENVGNARAKGDRGNSTTPDDELSYDIVDILSGVKYDGICEHSGMTSTFLEPASELDIQNYFLLKEADALMELGKAKKVYANVENAINRFNKRITVSK